MALKLNPDIPLVWRNPTSMQFGVDREHARLDDVTPAQERIVAALVSGTSRSGLDVVADVSGAGAGEVDRVLHDLAPVLASAASPLRGEVAVIGTSPTAARIRSGLVACGLTVVPPTSRAELGILVSHYVVEPAMFGFWLGRDIPHLPIVFGDESVSIGPLVEPGAGPCLYCLERHKTDNDPAWPAIASQLWGRTSPSETALTIAEVAAITTRIAINRLTSGPASVSESRQLDASTGTVTHRTWAAHPECGCATLPENGSERVHPSAPDLTPPTREPAVSVPA
jgi:bacteriocin biosynthesis cyclodehydratase domain-containing protein